MSGPAGFPKRLTNNPLNIINHSLPTPHIGNPEKPAGLTQNLPRVQGHKGADGVSLHEWMNEAFI